MWGRMSCWSDPFYDFSNSVLLFGLFCHALKLRMSQTKPLIFFPKLVSSPAVKYFPLWSYQSPRLATLKSWWRLSFPFSPHLKFLSLCFSKTSGSFRDSLNLSPSEKLLVMGSSFSLEKSPFPGYFHFSGIHLGTSSHTAAELFVFILPLPVDSAFRGGGCVLYSLWCLACGKHWVNTFWIGMLWMQGAWGDGCLIPLAKSGFHSL